MTMPVISAYDFANFAEETFSEDSPLKSFYRDKVVLMTGGTGDLGQVYVEKLLRCNIKRLYLLVRDPQPGDTTTTATDGQPDTADQRLQTLLSSALFANLRKSQPRFISRIHPIRGDLAAIGLGLSPADRSLLCSSVQLIVHAGAETSYSAQLRAATLANVRGTREIIRLAADTPSLLGIAHISTLFSQSHRSGAIEERLYGTSLRPQQMIEYAEARSVDLVDDNALELLASHLMRPWPNAYTFTMALAERLMADALPQLAARSVALVVVRPSAVLSTMEDPVAGYTTSAYGVNELMIAIATGAMRVLPVAAQRQAPVCLADYAVNVSLAGLQQRHADPQKAAAVYNATLNHADLRWGSLTGGILQNTRDNPVLRSVWAPRVHLLSNCVYEVWWYVLLYELVPGLLVDALARMVGCGGRLMPRMRRNVRAREEYGFLWSGQDRELVCERAEQMFKGLDRSDRVFFPFDLAATFDWNDYSYKYALGLKRYVLGENLNNREEAQRRQRHYRWAHLVVLAGYYAVAVAIGLVLLRPLGLCARVRGVLH